MPASEPSGTALLERAYEDLGLLGSDLIKAASTPPDGVDPRVWREVGDWLLLGDRVGAERIFFVHDDPVLVFSALPSGTSEKEIMSLYRRAWSMARPRCLFLAIGQELRVYGLDAPPVGPDESDRKIEPLEIVKRAAEVSDVLSQFHRDSLESGATFEDDNLFPSSGRADQRLLQDVQAATDALVESGLEARDAHSLIERAILIRYLEDREVLTAGYFEDIANKDAKWKAALNDPSASEVNLGAPSRFIKCLSDKDLTYALFERLARDFNGDLFVPDPHEQTVVSAGQLHLLRDLLLGVASSSQEPLFLWAYDFSVVPTSLVSTMYEFFYNQEGGEQEDNTHYTPPELVEFVLADLLQPSVLERSPKICDPACGSGIFLVEAYRRIVRYEAATAGEALSTERLRSLLLERIAGCDINESAVRLAAFSLYVAFLNYQTPHDIREAGPLPALIHRGNNAGSPAPLIVADAFPPVGDAEDAQQPNSSSPWSQHSFDVVVGNPPWSEPRGGSKTPGELWAKKNALPVGDRSPSQLFIWRALDLLADDGVAALLISAKVLFNVRSTSQAFRNRWLSDARIDRVVNFSDVRRDYFEQAIAPFALVRFRRADGSPEGPVVYETARRVSPGRRGSLALARLDRRIVEQGALRSCGYLWKTYSAGSHLDVAFLARLELNERLRDLLPDVPKSQYGYQRAKAGEGSAHPPDAQWRDLPSLKKFDSWGPLRDEWFDDSIPSYVKFVPDPALFCENSLLVRRFVGGGGPAARLMLEPMAFRHTIYGIPMGHRPKWHAQVALGTILSALGRYWLCMVSGSWGTWMDEIRADDLLNLPVRIDRGHPATKRIIEAVKQLPHAAPLKAQLSDVPSLPDVAPILADLDGAVEDLFELTAAERDLVNDFWASRTPAAAKPTSTSTNTSNARSQGELSHYLEVFQEAWKPQLAGRAELDGQIWQDHRAEVIAAVFETRNPQDPSVDAQQEEDAWTAVLERYNLALRHQTRTGVLLTYGMLRAVTDSAIVIVKRDESRLWSATAAREDAEATIAQTMSLQLA